MGTYLAALALALAGPAHDTTLARVTGIVMDTSGHPIGSAEVRLDTAQWRHVSENGAFALLQVVAGRHLLVIRSPGFAVDSLDFRAEPGESIGLTAVVHRLTVLVPVDVVGRPDTARPVIAFSHDWMEGFAGRKAHNNGGTFLDQATIDRKGAMRMTELLRGVPGVRLLPVLNEYGGDDYKIVMRGASTVSGAVCPIQYYFDGHPFSESDDIDRLVSPHEVAAMEIYPGASQVPEQFKGPHARCGVIVIWTKSVGGHI
ncbi:MAG: Plug and carboxypeptidase regulatory-like domain-containing protein [Gemmatimonadota bacterium]|nr:Plug and carboxypeptidase regulatory-like domain-containing protein [Gemmatimonadota bacterium]